MRDALPRSIFEISKHIIDSDPRDGDPLLHTLQHVPEWLGHFAVDLIK